MFKVMSKITSALMKLKSLGKIPKWKRNIKTRKSKKEPKISRNYTQKRKFKKQLLLILSRDKKIYRIHKNRNNNNKERHL